MRLANWPKPCYAAIAQYFKTELKWEQGFYWHATACIFISLLFYLWLPDTKKNSRMEHHT